jgi:tyrosyl-tRNA synthetase
MPKNFVEELRWRGMLQDIMPGTEEMLSKEQVTGYVGFDPTADSLHCGSLVPIMYWCIFSVQCIDPLH